MTAAQDYLVRELVAQINAKNAELATDPPANPGGIIFVTSRNQQAAPAYTVNITLTSISGGALDIVETPGASAGVMGVTEIRIPAEIAAGDTVAFDTPGASPVAPPVLITIPTLVATTPALLSTRTTPTRLITSGCLPFRLVRQLASRSLPLRRPTQPQRLDQSSVRASIRPPCARRWCGTVAAGEM